MRALLVLALVGATAAVPSGSLCRNPDRLIGDRIHTVLCVGLTEAQCGGIASGSAANAGPTVETRFRAGPPGNTTGACEISPVDVRVVDPNLAEQCRAASGHILARQTCGSVARTFFADLHYSDHCNAMTTARARPGVPRSPRAVIQQLFATKYGCCEDEEACCKAEAGNNQLYQGDATCLSKAVLAAPLCHDSEQFQGSHITKYPCGALTQAQCSSLDTHPYPTTFKTVPGTAGGVCWIHWRAAGQSHPELEAVCSQAGGQLAAGQQPTTCADWETESPLTEQRQCVHVDHEAGMSFKRYAKHWAKDQGCCLDEMSLCDAPKAADHEASRDWRGEWVMEPNQPAPPAECCWPRQIKFRRNDSATLVGTAQPFDAATCGGATTLTGQTELVTADEALWNQGTGPRFRRTGEDLVAESSEEACTGYKAVYRRTIAPPRSCICGKDGATARSKMNSGRYRNTPRPGFNCQDNTEGERRCGCYCDEATTEA